MLLFSDVYFRKKSRRFNIYAQIQHVVCIVGARGRRRPRASTLLETFRGKFTYGENAREDGRAHVSTLMAKLRGNILMEEGRE